MDLVLLRLLFVALLGVVCYFLQPFGLPGWAGALVGVAAAGADPRGDGEGCRPGKTVIPNGLVGSRRNKSQVIHAEGSPGLIKHPPGIAEHSAGTARGGRPARGKGFVQDSRHRTF